MIFSKAYSLYKLKLNNKKHSVFEFNLSTKHHSPIKQKSFIKSY